MKIKRTLHYNYKTKIKIFYQFTELIIIEHVADILTPQYPERFPHFSLIFGTY